jgi:hypothetical protein
MSAAVVATSSAYQQDDKGSGKLSHAVKQPGLLQGGPVTEAEARVTFNRISQALHSVTKVKAKFPLSNLGDSSQPVSREAIILQMNRIYEAAKPYFKINPTPVPYDPAVLSVKKGTEARVALEKLVKGGFIPRVCVLATSSSDTIAPEEFGDTIGLFAARIADVTHMPNAEYSPYLNGDFRGS